MEDPVKRLQDRLAALGDNPSSEDVSRVLAEETAAVQRDTARMEMQHREMVERAENNIANRLVHAALALGEIAGRHGNDEERAVYQQVVRDAAALRVTIELPRAGGAAQPVVALLAVDADGEEEQLARVTMAPMPEVRLQ